MKALDAIYYQFYLFYKNKFKIDNSPDFFATIAICSVCFFVLMGVVGIVTLLLFGKLFDWLFYFLMVGVFVLFYMHFNYSGRWMTIVKEKPYIRSEKFSRRMTLLFFIIGIVFLFGTPLIGRYIHLGSMI